MSDVRAQLLAAEIERYHEAALRMADAARDVIQSLRRTGVSVTRKPDNSLVTNTDFAVEQRLRELIAADYPTHGIVGEEYPPANADSPFQWILDPIDGTEEFARGIPTYGSIIALHFRNQPLVGVIDHGALSLRVHGAFGLGAWRGKRRIALADAPHAALNGGDSIVICARHNFTRHSNDDRHFDRITRSYPNHRIFRSCYGHTLAITGNVDAMVEYGNRVWDLAASRVLTEEAGGKYVTVQEIDVPGIGLICGAVFGKQATVDKIIELLAA